MEKKEAFFLCVGPLDQFLAHLPVQLWVVAAVQAAVEGNKM